MFRPEYLLLMRMLNYNILFDDKNDKLFIYDFDIVSKFEPSLNSIFFNKKIKDIYLSNF